MPEFVRTFIAMPVQATRELKRVLNEMRRVSGPVRVVGEEELHLTLAFLGDTPLNQTPQISELLRTTLHEYCAMDFSIAGVGAFPNSSRPRVIWAGITPVDPLRSLANELSDPLSDLGFPKEERRYTPHLTLARVKGRPPAELLDLIREFRETFFGEFHADRVVYYQSELNAKGPRYTPLANCELQLGTSP